LRNPIGTKMAFNESKKKVFGKVGDLSLHAF
jgi:hypothetical protein